MTEGKRMGNSLRTDLKNRPDKEADGEQVEFSEERADTEDRMALRRAQESSKRVASRSPNSG